jgi:hypothetical protein
VKSAIGGRKQTLNKNETLASAGVFNVRAWQLRMQLNNPDRCRVAGKKLSLMPVFLGSGGASCALWPFGPAARTGENADLAPLNP